MNLPAARSFSRTTLLLSRIFLVVALPGAMAMSSAIANDENAPPQNPESKTEAPVEAKPPAEPVVSEPAGEASKKEDAPKQVALPVQRIEFTKLPEAWQTLKYPQASEMMRDIERRINVTNPDYPVVILDDDSINIRPHSSLQTFRNRLYEVLNDRKVSLRWHFKSEAMTALGGLKGPNARDPVAIRMHPDHYKNSTNPLDQGSTQSQACLVIAPVPDVSSLTLIERWIGHAGSHYMKPKIDPGPYVMMKRAAWHEVWHCIDKDFYKDQYTIPSDPAISNAHRMHMSEVFADVAATLTLAVEGHIQIPQVMGDVRAISSDWNGRRSTRGSRPNDENYYDGAVYMLTPAQDLVVRHIQEIGTEALSRYTLDDIRRVARDITQRGALSRDEFKALADYYARGDVAVNDLKAQVAAGDRAATQKLGFINHTKERLRQARDRMLEDTGVAIREEDRPRPSTRPHSQSNGIMEEAHYDVADYLRDMNAAEKEEMIGLVRAGVQSSIDEGHLPEQGVFNLIEDWRRKVHEKAPNYKAYERKLFVLSLMLSYGELNETLGRGKVVDGWAQKKGTANKAEEKPAEQPVEKPADTAPANPAIPTLPETPPTKWQTWPQEHDQARVIMRYQFKLG